MKIYTRRGDGGQTDLFSGERVSKGDGRLDAYGTVDELNANLARLAAALPDALAAAAAEVRRFQSDLFAIGSNLATTAGTAAAARVPALPAERVPEMEAAIDRLQAGLPELRHFILPGGHDGAIQAHVARTVCRRAERAVVRLMAGEEGSTDPRVAGVVLYLNRLSDYLFALARACNASAGIADQEWR